MLTSLCFKNDNINNIVLLVLSCFNLDKFLISNACIKNPDKTL